MSNRGKGSALAGDQGCGIALEAAMDVDKDAQDRVGDSRRRDAQGVEDGVKTELLIAEVCIAPSDSHSF